MSVNVYVSSEQISIQLEKPLVFPESPLIGDIIDVRGFQKYGSDERRHLIENLEAKKLKSFGKVVERHWASQNPDKIELFITVELERQ